MSRRTELEKEIETLGNQIKNATADTPVELLNEWKKVYDALSFELNNLYDDLETPLPN